jgi:hypothetical protein
MATPVNEIVDWHKHKLLTNMKTARRIWRRFLYIYRKRKGFLWTDVFNDLKIPEEKYHRYILMFKKPIKLRRWGKQQPLPTEAEWQVFRQYFENKYGDFNKSWDRWSYSFVYDDHLTEEEEED